MASIVPKFVKKEIIDGWVAENLWLMLLDNTFTPNAETNHYVSDVVSKEIVDSGGVYTSGGILIEDKTQQYDGLIPANAYLDALTNPSIGPGATLNYRYGVVYKNTGNQATSPIRCIIDFITDQIVVNGTSLIEWNALGIMYIS